LPAGSAPGWPDGRRAGALRIPPAHNRDRMWSQLGRGAGSRIASVTFHHRGMTASLPARPVASEVMVPERPQLSPAQEEVLVALGARRHERPTFDPRLRNVLRDELEARLGPIAAELPDEATLWVRKHDLATVHGCEQAWLAEDAEPFTWSPPRARGVVSHKAVELSVHWQGEPTPAGLVDEAVARLTHGADGLGEWLATAGEGELAELRSDAVERVAKFLECFPPLEARWRPVAESRLRVELCEDRLVLSGKADLTVGAAEGSVAGKVIIDLKTGGPVAGHRDDLRFYALIEAIRLGVPPRLVASYYLDSGRLVAEPVTEDLLWAAVERVVAGVEAMAALRRGERQPVLRPGPSCRWCSLQSTCDEGARWLEDQLESGLW
jgi:CRISPR/Cas system-associated exonuclease Cas4 (RecB family)